MRAVPLNAAWLELEPQLVALTSLNCLIKVTHRSQGEACIKVARLESSVTDGGSHTVDIGTRARIIANEAAILGALTNYRWAPALLASDVRDTPSFIVTEWIQGRSVDAVSWSSDTRNRIALELLLSLEALHRAGVAHRDVSPEHVLWTDRRLWLIDYGRAVFLRRLPPEEAQSACCRDLHSLGCVLAQLLLGARPFAFLQTDEADVAVARMAEVRTARANPRVLRIVERAIAALPSVAARQPGVTRPYRSIAAFGRDLRPLLSSRSPSNPSSMR